MMRHCFMALLLCGTVLSSFAAERCEVWEDPQRITHARAQSEESFSYCFGYLHGRDRSWMMDHFRRVAFGKNAEVHGFGHLKGDMMMRLLNIPAWADKLYAQLGADERLMLRSYAKGVNHGFRLARQQPSGEFLNGHPFPEKWKPQHTLAVLLLQSFDQTRKTFFTEWEEARGLDRWGKKAQTLFDADGTPWDTTILKEGEYQKTNTEKKTSSTNLVLPPMWAKFPSVFGEESGSNNWVVAPKLTRGGKAMLANDPHLDLKTPMFWYWVHLEGPTTDVIGASLPGVPLIVSGTNRRVSWGLTNAYINTADAVHIDEKDAEELESFRPVVWVKWGFLKIPIFFKSFQRTKEGFPVLPLETTDSRPMVLKWSGFHITGADLASLRHMMKSRSSEEMERSLAGVGIPAWNFVFADIYGKIGHRVVGKVFRTPFKHAVGLNQGTLAEIRKPEFLNPDEMPHTFNPKRGWISTANNRHWPSDSSFYGGRGYTPGFRATRLEELLKKEVHDLQSFRKIQCDDQSSDAPYLVPLLVEAISASTLDNEQKAWIEELKSWNMMATLDCRVCPVYRRTLDIAMEKLMVHEIGFWRLGTEKNQEWQTTTQAAFKDAWGDLKGKVWRDVHLNPFTHLSGRKDWVFTREIPTRGDKHSVDPGSVKWNDERKVFDHFSGASERLVVMMNDIPEVWLSLPGLNTRYDQANGKNPWQEWADCRQERVEWPIDWKGKQLEKVEIEM